MMADRVPVRVWVPASFRWGSGRDFHQPVIEDFFEFAPEGSAVDPFSVDGPSSLPASQDETRRDLHTQSFAASFFGRELGGMDSAFQAVSDFGRMQAKIMDEAKDGVLIEVKTVGKEGIAHFPIAPLIRRAIADRGGEGGNRMRRLRVVHGHVEDLSGIDKVGLDLGEYDLVENGALDALIVGELDQDDQGLPTAESVKTR